METTVNKFLLGADPEFVALREKELLSCASLNGHNDGGTIGWDHSGVVGELRPKPSRTSKGLLANMQKLLAHKQIADLQADELIAGSTIAGAGPLARTVTLGGHIHLDLNPFRDKRQERAPIDHWGKALWTDFDEDFLAQGYSAHHERRMRAFDRLTRALEQAKLLPDSEHRRRFRYGRYSQFRSANGRTEYRTMPSWLFSPAVADLCITGVKLIAHNPLRALALLNAQTPSFGELQKLYMAYATRDSDAARVSELVSRGPGPIATDLLTDFRPAWAAMLYAS